jgi:formylglycine-generating enzyme required for sulfatase activity
LEGFAIAGTSAKLRPYLVSHRNMASSFQLIINKRQGQNQYYEESLAEGCRPLEMMSIPSGSFLMGSPKSELERLPREGPQHEVALSKFFMAKHPITQAQWRAVAAMPQVKRELRADPSKFKGDTLPVEQVSWYEAVEFCDRLNRFVENRLTMQTNQQHYSLPTEAEWEYACRAGTTTPFHFGETITTDLANYNGTNDEEQRWSGSYGYGPNGVYLGMTTPVDQFDSANSYGLCNMHGNVYEWCQDHWHDSYEGAPTDGSAWFTGDEDAARILRGGSWFFIPRYCRSAYRNYSSPDTRNNYIGFRVTCVVHDTLNKNLSELAE